jgi:predicted CXXCH cytochrome family protein
MGRAFAAFREDRTGADFAVKNRFYHKASNSYFTMLRRGDDAFMRRHQIGVGGEEINVVEKRVDYVMGSGHKAQTLIHRNPRNELVELPVAWYTAKGGYWAMNPNYDRPDHEGFRRRIRYDCFFCHNAYPQIDGRADDFHADPIYPEKLPEGIDCQRCHGPGQAHVDAAARKSQVNEIRSAIVNPKRLKRDQQMEICLQCHLQSTSSPLPHSIVKPGRGVFSFRAGEPLADYAAFFDHPPGAGYDDKFEIAHAAYRLRQSACYVQSTMTCTTCHNPHDVKRGDAAVAQTTTACRACHQQVSARAEHNKAGECVSCHMPQRRTEDAVEVVMTDHRIVRRPAKGDLTARRAERSGPAYRGPVAAYYPEKPGELAYAIAQVRTGTNLAAGISLLERAAKDDASCGADCLFELSESYGKAGRLADAARIAEETLRRSPGHLYTLRSYGTYLSAQGELARGAELLEQARAKVPDHPRTLHDLGLNYARQGRFDEAVRLLREALRSDSDSPEIHFSLASVLSSRQDLSGAEVELREAIRAKPDYGLAHATLASLLEFVKRPAEAEPHWSQAERHAPDNARMRQMYARSLMARQRMEEAMRQWEAAVRLEPANLESRFYLGMLLAGSGDGRRAVEHLQQAARSEVAEIRDRARQALDMISQGR